ncbi:transmembrane protein 134 isoform X2 [Lemur catta]|uniref:transmembrane protein 134 isoform X2 n=1 Tax=Lemur catta TaxID=9447 RepID=UPI001E26B755|nr:transmembrane protein 134 isoform X2 [Lemur catta]
MNLGDTWPWDPYWKPSANSGWLLLPKAPSIHPPPFWVSVSVNHQTRSAGRAKGQNLENDEDGAQASPELDGGVGTRDPGRTSIRSSQWSFSTISSSTQRSYNACCSWTQHPLIQKNRRVVLASFLLLLLGLVLILVGVGLEVAPSAGVSSAIFFVPGFLLLVPGVYHVIFIYCAVKGHRGFQFFYLPYFEK